MRDFISLLISFVIMAIADSVDVSFGNRIGIDAVVVIGCTSSFIVVVRSFARLGAYTYQIIRRDEEKCIVFDIVFGTVVGIMLFVFRGTIVDLYSITDSQEELFNDVLIASAILVPCHGAGNIAFEITRLKGELKIYRNGMLLFYSLLILSDLLIYLVTKNLALLYIGTSICQLVVLVYFSIKMKFRYRLLDFAFVREIFKYGFPVCIERLLNGFVLTASSIVASHMESGKYAVYCVCRGAITTAQSLTNAYNASLMISINGLRYKDALEKIKFLVKPIFPLLAVVYVIYSTISVIIYSGSVPISSCFPIYFVFMLEFFGLLIYESFKVLCISQKNITILPKAVLAGGAVRIGVCLLGLYFGGSMILFALSTPLDWGFRGVLYYISVRRKYVREELHC